MSEHKRAPLTTEDLESCLRRFDISDTIEDDWFYDLENQDGSLRRRVYATDIIQALRAELSKHKSSAERDDKDRVTAETFAEYEKQIEKLEDESKKYRGWYADEVCETASLKDARDKALERVAELEGKLVLATVALQKYQIPETETHSESG